MVATVIMVMALFAVTIGLWAGYSRGYDDGVEDGWTDGRAALRDELAARRQPVAAQLPEPEPFPAVWETDASLGEKLAALREDTDKWIADMRAGVAA